MRSIVERTHALLTAYSAGLREKRVRGHALVIAAGLWLASSWTVATPGLFDRNGILKGVDFLQFYVAGRVVANGHASSLYDWPAFARELSGSVAGLGDTLFLSVYPPVLAVLFAPLGRLGYGTALVAWSAVSAGVYALSLAAVFRSCTILHPHRGTYVLAAAGFVPFQQLILHGQVGSLVLGLFVAAWLALRRGRLFWVGLSLGLLILKPQFGIAAVLGFICTWSVSLLIGAVTGAVLAIAGTLPFVGTAGWLAYVQKVPVILQSEDVFEPKLWQMHNLKAAIGLLLGTGALGTLVYVLAAAATVVVVRQAWKASADPDLRAATLVLGVALVNPHLYVYDLLIVALPLVLIVTWTLRHPTSTATPAARALSHALCWVPLLGPLAAITHVQLTAPLLVLLLVSVKALAREQPDGAHTARLASEAS